VTVPAGGGSLRGKDGRTLAPGELVRLLEKCWSAETASTWTSASPARGQCSVTALALLDRFGGRLLKTRTAGGWHFYNEIDGEVRDFTASQFASPIAYDHEPATAAEALADTSAERVRILSERLDRELRSG
jgi:hypothetical protein